MPTVACHKSMSIQVGPSCKARASTYLSQWLTRIAGSPDIPSPGPPSGNTQNKVFDFLCDLCSDDLDLKMLSVVLFVPDDLVSAATPVIYNFGVYSTWRYYTNGSVLLTTIATASQFFSIATSGLTTPGTGGPGFNGFVRTGVSFAGGVDPNNAGYSLQVTAGGGAGYSSGARGALPSAELSLVHGFDIPPRYRMYRSYDASGPLGANPGAVEVPIGATTTECFLSGNRTSAVALALYRGRSGAMTIEGTTAGTSGSNATPHVYLFGLDNNAVFSNPVSGTISFCAFHTGLTFAQTNRLYTAVQTFRAAIGGGTI